MSDNSHLQVIDLAMALAPGTLRPVRVIKGWGSRQGVIGKFSSKKMGRMVRFESTLERDFLFWCEFDPDAQEYVEQPFTVRFTYRGKRRRYTPDFLVAYRSGRSTIVEVKPRKKLLEPEVKLKLQSVAEIWTGTGLDFVVLTETEIRREPQLRNIRLLHRYARVAVPQIVYLSCLEYLRVNAAPTFQEVLDALSTSGLSKARLYSLINKGVLTTDLSVSLDEKSILRLTLMSSRTSHLVVGERS